MHTLYLCGAGNPEGVRLALRVNEASRRWNGLVSLDDDPRTHGRDTLGVVVEGGFERLREGDGGTAQAVNLVARTCPGRRRAAERIEGLGGRLVGLVSRDVDLLGTRAAADLIAYPNATIGAEAEIDAGCVVFMGAAVGHESRVGRDCVIAANAVLNARVVLGDGVYVGSSAVVLPGVTVGAGAVIGAGATVIDDVPAGATVVGPVCSVAHPGDSAAAGAASGDVERIMAGIWREVLGVPAIGADRNFFDVGGTSLLALRMLQRVEQKLGVRASLLDFFEAPTLRSFSSRLGARDRCGSGDDAVRTRLDRRREALDRLGARSL